MTVWNAYGSEHSSDLVVIGHFGTIADAARAEWIIERITQQVRADIAAGLMSSVFSPRRFTEGIFEVLKELETYTIEPAELSQFDRNGSVKRCGQRLIFTTGGYNISAFLKILVTAGARVEVFAGDNRATDDER